MLSKHMPSTINHDDDGPIIETIDTIEVGSLYSLDDLLVTSNIHAEEFIALAKKNIDLARLAFTNHPTIKKILSGANYAENLRQIVLPHESLALSLLVEENGKFWETITTPAFLWELAGKHESIDQVIIENDTLLTRYAYVTDRDIRNFLLQETHRGTHFHRIDKNLLKGLIHQLRNHEITSKLTMAQLHDLSKYVRDDLWLDVNHQELTRMNLYRKLIAEKTNNSTHEDICQLVDDYFHPKTEEEIKSEFSRHLFQAAYDNKKVLSQLTDESLASFSGTQLNLICNKHGFTLKDSARKRALASFLLNEMKYRKEIKVHKNKSNLANKLEDLPISEINYLLGVTASNYEIKIYYFSQAALYGNQKAFGEFCDAALARADSTQDVTIGLYLAEALCANPEWDTDDGAVLTDIKKRLRITQIRGVNLFNPIHNRLNTLKLEDDHYEAVCTFYLNLVHQDSDTYRDVAKALGAINPGKALEAYRKVPPRLLAPIDVIEMTNLAMMDVWNKQAEEILTSLPAEVLASLSDNNLENKELIYQALDQLNDRDKKEQRIKACLHMLFKIVTAYASMPAPLTKADTENLESSIRVIDQFLTELAGTHAQSYTHMENIVLALCENTPAILINKTGYNLVMRYVASPSAMYKMGMFYAVASDDKVVGLTTARLWHQASNLQNGKNAGMTRLLAVLATIGDSDCLEYVVLYYSLKAIIKHDRFHLLDFLEEVHQLPEVYTQIRYRVRSMLAAKDDNVNQLNALKQELATCKSLHNEFLALEKSVAKLPARHVAIRRLVQKLKNQQLVDNKLILLYAGEIFGIKLRNILLNILQLEIDELPNHHQTLRNKVAVLQTHDMYEMDDYTNLDTEVEDTIGMDEKLTALQTEIDALPIQYQDIRSHTVALLITDHVTDDDYKKCLTYLGEVELIVAKIADGHARAHALPDRFVAIKDAFEQHQNNEVLRMDTLNEASEELIKIENSLRMQIALQPKIAGLPNQYRYIREAFDDAENRLNSNEVEMQTLESKVRALTTLAQRAGAQQAAMDVMLLPLAQLEKKLNNKNTKTKKECVKLAVVSQLHQTLRHHMQVHFSQDFSNPAAIKHDAFRDKFIQLIKSQLEDTNKGLKVKSTWQTRLADWLIRQLQRVFPHSRRVNAWAKSSSAHFKVAPEIGEGMQNRIEIALRH